MIGKTILHYKIIEKLGEGGMGVVYKAEDTKLKRNVAIKFLPRHIASNKEEHQRFEIEARAAAALNHPNIATIHAIEEVEDETRHQEPGTLFIVMEYIKGRELKEEVGSGKLEVERVVDFAIQIAEGLQAAHEKGIVHRDIKSANIMVTNEDKIKIMDFGLAKIKGGAELTKTGSTLGTAAYMSPEQTRGEEVDHRTDVWSFGVVLYEMITGKYPFAGDYEQAVIYSILNVDPEPISALRPGVSVELERIVGKALKKNPDERYQQLNEMLVDLKSVSGISAFPKNRVLSLQKGKATLTVGLFLLIVLGVASGFYYWLQTSSDRTAPPRASIQRLAVLPFTNVRHDPEIDFLGFALADQIIGSLSYLKNILVRPSSSIRRYQDQSLDRQAVGADLKVDIILTGNYLKEANTIRLNIELVNVAANEMIWREPIEVEYENAFALQDIVSEKVIDRLELQFSQDERARMQGDVSQNPLAYEYFLRSISYPATSEGDLLAIEMLNNSIQLDSSYAPAYAELGFRRQRHGNYGLAGVEEIGEAEQAYLHALLLNDELLDALWHLATLYTETSRAEKAVELARRILMINPNNALAHFSLAYVYRYAGMLDESEKEYDLALELDPGNPRFRSAGFTYLCLGKYEKAIQAFNLNKGSSLSLHTIAWIYYLQGDEKKATETNNALLEQENTGVFYFLGIVLKALVEGEKETARSAITELEKANPVDGEFWHAISEIYSILGDVDSSIRTMEKSIKRGYFNYPYMISNPSFKNVVESEGFQRVLKMAKERHEAFKERFFSE